MSVPIESYYFLLFHIVSYRYLFKILTVRDTIVYAATVAIIAFNVNLV